MNLSRPKREVRNRRFWNGWEQDGLSRIPPAVEICLPGWGTVCFEVVSDSSPYMFIILAAISANF
jgi:hypothetical protein